MKFWYGVIAAVILILVIVNWPEGDKTSNIHKYPSKQMTTWCANHGGFVLGDSDTGYGCWGPDGPIP